MRSKKLQRYGIFMALLLVLILWRRSDASPDSRRGSSGKLLGREKRKEGIFPFHHPSANESHTHGSAVFSPPVLDPIGGENCSAAPQSRICYAMNLTACVPENGANESFLFMWILGETTLDVHLSILPANNFSNKTIPVPKKEKYNITAYVEQNSSIVLDGGEGKLCVINMTSSVPSPPLIPSGSEEKSSQAGSTLYNTTAWNASKNVAAAAKCSAWSNSSCSSKNLTACPYPDSDAASITSLLFQNGEDNPLTVDITLLPANTNLSLVNLPAKEWQMVNVTGDKLGNITSIRLSTGDGLCEFKVVSESDTPKHFSYVGVLLFISGVVILAAALAYWKLRAATRRANGIAYEQLERGMPNTSSIGGGTSQTAGGGWDQSWGDDDWDEVKAVKSPRSVQKGNFLANSIKDD